MNSAILIAAGVGILALRSKGGPSGQIQVKNLALSVSVPNMYNGFPVAAFSFDSLSAGNVKVAVSIDNGSSIAPMQRTYAVSPGMNVSDTFTFSSPVSPPGTHQAAITLTDLAIPTPAIATLNINFQV